MRINNGWLLAGAYALVCLCLIAIAANTGIRDARLDNARHCVCGP